MILRCECGGTLEIQRGTDPDASGDGFLEVYECVACGRTGTYRHDPVTGDSTSGCVTTHEVYR